MTAELTSSDYAFLFVLKAEGREISNTEMYEHHELRLKSPVYEKLNAEGLVQSDTTSRPYKHVITKKGRTLLDGRLTIADDYIEKGTKRTPREKALWAALVATHNDGGGPASPPEPEAKVVADEPRDLDARIRATYAELAGAPGKWVNLADLRPLLADVPTGDLDEALIKMLDTPDVRLEPEPFGHRINAEAKAAAVHVGGEDRHKIAIGLR
jgi:hypothetical protein